MNELIELAKSLIGLLTAIITLFIGIKDPIINWINNHWNVYDLRLISVNTADDLVNEGRNLVIVALVGTNLHIRIFDANGNRVVDKAENELMSGDTLTMLKKQLNPLPDKSCLSQEQKQKIIQDATSIAGHTNLKEKQNNIKPFNYRKSLFFISIAIIIFLIYFFYPSPFLITKPRSGDSVSITETIEGKTPYQNKQHFIIITSQKTLEDYIQDGPMSVSTDGSISGSAIFGKRTAGQGESYVIRLIATKSTTLSSRDPIPKDAIYTNSVTVIRK